MPAARYKQLVDRFAQQIRSGALLPGTRLPTHRSLAQQERLALTTASRVYAELESMGLVSAETGRGTFVRETSVPAGHGIDQSPTAPGMLDLNFNYPELPEQAELLRSALRNLTSAGDLDALLRYQPHAGRPHERAIIAEHLSTRGLAVTAEQVLLVSGAQHGLTVALMSLLQAGDVIAADALTYPGFKAIAHALQLEVLPLAPGENGPDLAALDALCQRRKVRALYCMPTLHNPLGWVMARGQRKQLAALARKHDLLLIEDAAYAFLAVDPPPPLYNFAPERTLYVSGFSKSVATGLRVGYLVAPVSQVANLERAIRATAWNTPTMMTRITCDWITDGTVSQLEQAKRRDAAARQQCARRVLQGLPWQGHPNSYFLWLPLPATVRAEQVVSALLQRNVSVSSAAPFAVGDHRPQAIRLALGSLDTARLESALLLVKEVIDAVECGALD